MFVSAEVVMEWDRYAGWREDERGGKRSGVERFTKGSLLIGGDCISWVDRFRYSDAKRSWRATNRPDQYAEG